MSTWNPNDLDRLGTMDEIRIAGERADGTLRTPRIIWLVRHGDDLYVRSAHGTAAGWWRGTKATGIGHISGGNVEQDVIFEDASNTLNAELDAAYRAKYGKYPKQYVEPVAGPESHATTIRLVPRERSRKADQ